MHAVFKTLGRGVYAVESPLQRLEHSMHIPVAFLVIPLFALANAGIPIELDSLGEGADRVGGMKPSTGLLSLWGSAEHSALIEEDNGKYRH